MSRMQTVGAQGFGYRYCPHGCHNGWLWAESEFGTTCPIHANPEPERIFPRRPRPTAERLAELRKMRYEDFLLSPEWAKTRDLALLVALYRCERCNNGADLQVHHLTYERRGHEDIADLEVVCRLCHEREHDLETEQSVLRQQIAEETVSRRYEP